jgi:hypothetical protein
VALAAGLAAALLPDPRTAGDVHTPGRVFMIDVRTDRVAASRVVPVHGCRCCDEAATPGVRRKARLARLEAAVHGRQAQRTGGQEGTP